MSIKHQITDPVGKWETIHPKEAASMLTRLHPKQTGRHNKGAILTYARQMKNGEWRKDLPSPVLVDWDNRLMNGYHRFHAVVTAGVPVRFFVVRGLDPESFGDVDNIVSRTLAFRTGMGISRASVVNCVAYLCTYPAVPGKMDRVRAETIQDFISDELDYLDKHVPATAKLRVTQAGVRAGLVLAMMQTSADRKTMWPQLCDMYRKLVTSDFTHTTPSMAALHGYLFRERQVRMRVIMAAHHAFSPDKWDNNRIRVQNQLGEIQELQNNILKDLVEAIK